VVLGQDLLFEVSPKESGRAFEAGTDAEELSSFLSKRKKGMKGSVVFFPPEEDQQHNLL